MRHLRNTYKKIGIMGLLALMVVTYSCTDLASVNDDPNEPAVAATSHLLTSAQKGLADNYWDDFSLGYFGNLYAQYWSQNQYTAESRYEYRTGVVNNIWNSYYTTLNTLEQIIRQNRNNPVEASAYGNNANQIAVAKILKAWTFQTLTDTWGDIPVTEALEGAENPSPAYDTQEVVYQEIIRLLTEASDSISVGADGFPEASDIFYGGDMKKWKKFANSLKLRAAMRIADVVDVDAYVDEALTAGVMESNEDNALFTFLSSTPNNNPINEAFKTRKDFAVSEPLMNLMQGKSDPRIPAYAAPADFDTLANGDPDPATFDYAGFPYGMTQGNATVYLNAEPWSLPSERVREPDAPAVFMTYAEVKFLEAEAVARGYTAGSAADLYEEAILASMEYWGVDDADAQSYVNNDATPYSSANWEEILGREKWVALYMQGVQGWAEWRRLDFGVLTPPVGGKLTVSFPGDIAIRYPYPSDEYSSNNTNVTEAVDRQGWSADDQGQKVWWDEN